MPTPSPSSRSPSSRPARATSSKLKTALPDEAAETLKRTGDTLNHLASECAAICSDDLAAALEAGSQSTRLLTDFTRSCVESCAASANAFAEIGREAMSCRTPSEVMDVQKRAMDAASASLTASGKLFTAALETWFSAADPFVSRIADGPQRMFRAVSAAGSEGRTEGRAINIREVA